MVTNQQLYIAVGIPMLYNAVLYGLLVAFFKMKFDKIDRRFDELEQRFDQVDRSFDDGLSHIKER